MSHISQETADRDKLIVEIRALRASVISKITRGQGGVQTMFDSFILESLSKIEVQKCESSHTAERQHQMDLLHRYLKVRARGRFVLYPERLRETAEWSRFPWELTSLQFAATQGIDQCLLWRGLPIFKSVFDFAMYPMLLSELRPATIIELGSGSGASAVWLADLLRANQIPGQIFSIDLRSPPLKDPNVTFIEGDCCVIDEVFRRNGLSAMPHPWLFIDDVHVNTLGVLLLFSEHAVAGDYIVVEDSGPKQTDLAIFMAESSAKFRVDSHYLDFFGRNAISSRDSIFVRQV
jgi:hypothetical protein